jgi:hypothetical protein
MSSQSLALCKRLFQATITCKEQCERLVPTAFNAVLLEALQHLMLQAVQLRADQVSPPTKPWLPSTTKIS